MEVVADGVVGLRGEDEVGRDQLGTLVKKLEEGVLSVGAWLAKHDGTWKTRLVDCISPKRGCRYKTHQ
jgi:hypothetical protein